MQLLILLPIVYLIQTGELENINGLNLKNCYPVQDPAVLKLESTYAMGDVPELTAIDFILGL